MNLRIEWHADRIDRRGFQAWIRPLFVHRLGWIVVALNITLGITDNYYLKALHPGGNTTYVLGPASLLGLFFTYLSIRVAHGDVQRRRKNAPPVKDTCVFYLTLTDDYAERGIIGQRFVRYHWRSFSNFEENDSRFILKISVGEFAIEKADVKDEDLIAKIRELLKSKLPRQAIT